MKEREGMPRKIPPVLGLALTNLLTAHGWKAKDLAAAAGCAPSTISACETGDTQLTRERLEELASRMGLGASDIERAVFAATVAHPGDPEVRSPVDPTPEQRRIILRAAATAGREEMEEVYETLLREVWAENAKRALQEGRELANRLKTFSEADRRFLIEAAPDYQHWGLAVCLCDDSESAAAHDPAEALKFAELALFVAHHVPGTEAWRSRLAGYCTGFIASAQKVANELRQAEVTFSRAWKSWDAGQDEAGLLSKARVLDLEASLRGAQGLFDKAIGLHDEALVLARPGEAGYILLNKSVTLGEKGDHEGSIQVLEQAEQEIDGERQPRLLFGARFNRAANLVRLSRAREAIPIIGQVRELAERLRNDLDLVKTLWLEANAWAGLGQRTEAIAALEQVRRDLARRELPFDHALASLDLALLYQKAGRVDEVQRLAVEMLNIFLGLQVHREATAALILFRDATARGAVTEELVRRLQDYLSKAAANPQLHFET
jgi:tetratricopeptide (TPR) repeat protein